MYFYVSLVDERQQLPECTCFAALGGQQSTPIYSRLSGVELVNY